MIFCKCWYSDTVSLVTRAEIDVRPQIYKNIKLKYFYIFVCRTEPMF